MNILVLGGAGFLGTNLILRLSKNNANKICAYDRKMAYFQPFFHRMKRVKLIEGEFNNTTDYDRILDKMDIVFHLESTSNPSVSNINIVDDISNNVIPSALMLDACVRNKIKRVVFMSSGGTVYGKEGTCPIDEETPLKPITSYGMQKMSIERLLYLYNYVYGLDYRIIRLSNPYGPYQRPNGNLGVVTTFVYGFVKKKTVTVYGDGSIIRDFIYIEDAITAIMNIAFDNRSKHSTYNVGSGKGVSLKELILIVENELQLKTDIEYLDARSVDVPINILNIGRYESDFGKLYARSLKRGIRDTYNFLISNEEL